MKIKLVSLIKIQMEDLEVGGLPESQKKQVKLTLLGNNSEFQLEEEN